MSGKNSMSYLLVFSNPIEGKEKEYNDWYTNIHIGEIVEIDGFVSAQRFKLSDTQNFVDQPYKYTAIYSIEPGRELDALENLNAAVPNLNMQDVIDLENINAVFIESISDLVVNNKGSF